MYTQSPIKRSHLSPAQNQNRNIRRPSPPVPFSYAKDCERIPSILSNLRRDLESRVSAAAMGTFPGTVGSRAKGASDAYTESLQVRIKPL